MDRVWYASYDPRVATSLEYPKEVLPILVQRNADRFAKATAMEFFGARLSYRSFWNHVQSLANALCDHGVKPGARVAIMLPNCPQTVISYYATLWTGGVAIVTNPMYVEREMEHQWNDSEAEFLIVLDHLYPKVEKVLPKTRIRTVLVTSIKDYLPLFFKYLYPFKAKRQNLFTDVPYNNRVLSFSKLISKTPPDPRACPATLDDLALLQYTGGTTGVSKGVMLSHRNILANVVQISAWFPDLRCGRERFLSILPFFHSFGMTVSMNMPLYTGNAAILLPRFEVNHLLKTIQKSKPTLFPGVPTIFISIVNHPKITSYDLSSVKYCITGSAPMPVEVLKKFEELTGGIIIEGYGLTESSPVTHCNPIGGVRKPGSIGIPMPDTDCRVVDLATGSEVLPPGKDGELIVHGPQVMQGYWKMPEETAATLREGWLHTGDIARMDQAGYTFIVDRKKDMIIAGGYNVYPREIDEVLYEHPKILDAVTVGIPDAYRGETVKAFVVVKPGESLSESEVIEFCKARLATYKIPKSIEFRESLPKTTVGKILRKDLRRKEIQKHETEMTKV